MIQSVSPMGTLSRGIRAAALLAVLASATSSLHAETMIPNGQLMVDTRYVGNCCYDFDIWQYAGSTGDVATIVATLPPGVTVSGASNGWTGPSPVISGSTVTWTIPSPGLTGQFPPVGPQYTIRLCFNNFTAPQVVSFQGFSIQGWTSSLLVQNEVLDGPPCTPPNPCPTDCPPQSRVQICYDGGRADTFAAPDDPTTPRAGFAAWLAGPPADKGYDNTTVNRQFGTTFQNLPCGIATARLEVVMRAECDVSSNDSIALMFNGTSFDWGYSIATLNGGLWDCPMNNSFSLDLSTLPGGVNLLPALNANRYLDLYVQDDTTVESARLVITVCPCDGPYRYYQSGSADNFAASPIDAPTSRQPRLDAVRNAPPFLWKNYDNCGIDRGVGHTFTGILGGIVRSDFTLRARACGGGSSNDSLHLELLNDGSPIIPYSGTNFYRGFNFSILNGSWNTGATNTFNFNLATTAPTAGGCGNILGALADSRFDYYVQDDSSVDYARLRVQPCPRIRRIWGTIIDVLGLPDVQLDPRVRGIFIPNIGSSGQDGVAFDVQGAEGYALAFAEGQTGLESDGASCRYITEADTDGDGEWEPISRIMCTNVGGVKEWNAAHPMLYRITNSQTGEVTEGSLEAGATIRDRHRPSRTDTYVWKSQTSASGKKHIGNVKYEEISFFVVPGRPPVMGDSLEMVMDVSDTPAQRFAVQWTAPVGTQASATISNGGPIQFGLLHTDCCDDGTSDRGLDTSPGVLALSNIGSSGTDGVTVHLDQADTYATKFSVGCAEQTGACTSGDVGVIFAGSQGGTRGDIVRSSVTFRPAFFDIFADLSPTGTHTVLVKIEREGQSVAEYTMDGQTASILAEGAAALSGCGKQPALIGGVRTSCIWWEFDLPIAFFAAPGLPGVHGDTIRIIAATPALPYDFTERATWTTSSTRELIFTDESVVPVGASTGCSPCAADYNQDGGIDGSDIDSFFSDWESGATCADANQDGGIDGSDVDTFFSMWENGGC